MTTLPLRGSAQRIHGEVEPEELQLRAFQRSQGLRALLPDEGRAIQVEGLVVIGAQKRAQIPVGAHHLCRRPVRESLAGGLRRDIGAPLFASCSRCFT